MFGKGILLVILLFILSGICRGNKEEGAENKNILIFFSMQPTTPAYRVILDGIRSQFFKEVDNNYNLHIEYLEADRFPKGSYPGERFDNYNRKYQHINLDLLICIGIDVISVVKQHASDKLLDLPAVSVDFDFSRYGFQWELALNNNSIVIPLYEDVEKNISIMLHLFPSTDSVFVVCGVSQIDQMRCEIAKQELNKLKEGVKFTFVGNISMDEVLNRVKRLPENSIIIVPSFITDSKGVPYYNTESTRLISSNANAPVFTFTSMGFGDGAVGGYIINFEKVGRITGDAAVRILKGSDPGSIKYTEKDYNEYLFDWRELVRWNIADSDRIPKGSIIMFEEVHFFGKYKWILTGGILFILAQTFLILGLIRMNRRQKIMTRQIRETENKYRELIREERIMQIAQLTASLSHEMNQPLTAILSNAQAGIRFVNSGKHTPELMNEIFQNIVEDDKRTASILSSVRGMLKLEKREKEHLNLNSLVNEVVAIFHSEARVHNIDIHIQLPEEPVYIFADGIQVQQVILNFIFNAMQSIEHSKTNNRSINITESTDNEYVTIAVRDFGKGISEEVKDKLFKPFVTSKKDGLGIGLSISQSIIQDHNGKIWAENKQDGGAEFSFSLKIHKV